MGNQNMRLFFLFHFSVLGNQLRELESCGDFCEAESVSCIENCDLSDSDCVRNCLRDEIECVDRCEQSQKSVLVLNTYTNNVPMVIGFNGEVDDDIDFTFGENTEVFMSCT